MIAIALHRSLSWVIACLDARHREQGDPSHGLRDKSADVRRAHVIGWTGLLRHCTRCRAGALHGNTNEIKTCGAIALSETLALPS
jgi:hypothetical protein